MIEEPTKAPCPYLPAEYLFSEFLNLSRQFSQEDDTIYLECNYCSKILRTTCTRIPSCNLPTKMLPALYNLHVVAPGYVIIKMINFMIFVVCLTRIKIPLSNVSSFTNNQCFRGTFGLISHQNVAPRLVSIDRTR